MNTVSFVHKLSMTAKRPANISILKLNSQTLFNIDQIRYFDATDATNYWIYGKEDNARR